MREIIYGALTTDTTLLEDIPAARWFAEGSVIDISVAPFAVLAWGPREGIMRAVSARSLRVEIHDSRGSYVLIDKILKRVEEVVLAQIDVTQGDSRVTEATWITASGDLDEPEYKTNKRYAEFRIAGR